jgi:hypothetical protein
MLLHHPRAHGKYTSAPLELTQYGSIQQNQRALQIKGWVLPLLGGLVGTVKEPKGYFC